MASNDRPETTTLSAKCHCKSTHITITIPTAALPLKTHLCHCHICRRVHGTLCCFHAPLPAGVVPILSPPSACTRYIHSPLAASARLFCSTCGCHIGDEDLEPPPDSPGGVPEWRIATSLFPSSALILGSHIYPPLSRPSLATWIPDMPSWTPARDDPTFPIPPPVAPDPDSEPEGGELLRAECMCGGVTFPVLRPPDIAPGAGADRQPLKGGAARLNAAVDRAKYVAQLDVSDDMRLTTGANVMAWMTVPAPVGFVDGLGFDGRGDSTLKVYQVRGLGGKGWGKVGFCGVCGATCFSFSTWMGEEGVEVGVLRVAIGILRAFVDGEVDPLAERWVEWDAEVLGEEEGRVYDGGFVERLGVGFKKWLDESGNGIKRVD